MVSARGLVILPSTIYTALLSRPSTPDPKCAPGGNFDLSHWSLQLPTGSAKGINVIPSKDLQGCHGYSGPHFHTHRSSGLMVLEAPGNPDVTGCVTTQGSRHCRSELRETNPDGRNAAWSSSGTNVLEVTMAVTEADDGTFGTAIGQVFARSKPLAAIYYSQKGNMTVDVKPGPLGHDHIRGFPVAQVPLGQRFTFRLSFSDSILNVAVDGKEAPLNLPRWPADECSFKLGNYNQGRSGDQSVVQVAEFTLKHASAASGRGRDSLLGMLGGPLAVFSFSLASYM
ncbi:polysaccharide lyase family 7 [Ophiocordyceps sinensis CO18]|uniref:Polysaccharide lyase family 7 n=1 Tax=Ophiocordyceps sinensis (strain Co18 / CGMCC 3.14243) TaxID=911162 RepID=T5A9X5_OPHSC|nr:polysaccharide lyase family 7 [Ophiocordyceps sinensis CO18]